MPSTTLSGCGPGAAPDAAPGGRAPAGWTRCRNWPVCHPRPGQRNRKRPPDCVTPAVNTLRWRDQRGPQVDAEGAEILSSLAACSVRGSEQVLGPGPRTEFQALGSAPQPGWPPGTESPTRHRALGDRAFPNAGGAAGPEACPQERLVRWAQGCGCRDHGPPTCHAKCPPYRRRLQGERGRLRFQTPRAGFNSNLGTDLV